MKVFTSRSKIQKNFSNLIFLDIETTGLSHNNEIISISTSDGIEIETKIIEDLKEEYELLISFLEKYNGRTFITYNGESFDLPFIKIRCKMYGLDFNYKSNDLYKYFNKYRYIFPMESLRQMEMEKYFEIERGRDISGREVVELFKDHLLLKNENSLEIIANHNMRDVEGLVELYERRFEIHKINRETVSDGFFEIRDLNFTNNNLEVAGITDFFDFYIQDKNYELKIENNNFTLNLYTKFAKYRENLYCNYLLKSDFPVEVTATPAPKEVVLINLKKIEMENLKNVVKFIFSKIKK